MLNNLQYWRKRFAEQLGALYPERECRQILRMALDAYSDRNEIDLLLHHENLDERTALQLSQFLERAVLGEPIQYILGYSMFQGLRIQVAPGVLIPRPETEELVAWIKETIPTDSVNYIADLGTGSGCILLALAQHYPKASCTGIDISAFALKLCTQNASSLNLDHIKWAQRDLLHADVLQNERYDLMVSNPPYIAPSEQHLMNPNVLLHEPHLALFTEENDPLIFYRHIAALLRKHLNPGGSLFLEVNEQYARAVQELFIEIPGTSSEIRKDLQGKNRMLRVQLFDPTI